MNLLPSFPMHDIVTRRPIHMCGFCARSLRRGPACNTPQGLQVEERDGFRYYQYDWSVVGGKPTALSTDDIDSALDGAP